MAATAPTPQGPDLAALKRMFSESQSLTVDQRGQSMTDVSYYHGKQLSPGEKRTLKKRRQPDGIYNRVRRAINGSLGVIRGSASDPRAFPRTPKDEQASDVATKGLRFVADKASFKSVRGAAAFDYLVPGTCAVIIEAGDDNDIPITEIRWEEFFYDPHARRPDLDDAHYKGIAKWQYADTVAQRYPQHAKAIKDAVDAGLSVDESFLDRPKSSAQTIAWVDGRRRRIMVVELYHKENGAWQRCVYYSEGVLDYGPSPYVDEKGRPICPIEAQTCYVDEDNNRYGSARDMRASQDEYTKRRQKALHFGTMRQVQERDLNSGRGIDVEVVRREAARADGVIPPGFQIVPTSDLAGAQLNLMEHAAAEIERMSPNPAMVGRGSEGQSGRAMLARQQAGMTEEAVVLGGFEAWELRVYRQVWYRIRQFWRAPMWIRVTDDAGAPQFIGLNQFQTDPATGEPVIDPATGRPMPMMDPQTGQPVPMNVMSELDVDIILELTPDTANLQAEQFQTLADLAKVYGPQEVSFDDLLEVSNLTDKAKLLEKRKARREQAQQMQAQQAQQAAAMAQQVAQAEAAKTQAEAQRAAADAGLKAAQTEETKVETQLKVAAAIQPAPVAVVPAGPPPGF